MDRLWGKAAPDVSGIPETDAVPPVGSVGSGPGITPPPLRSSDRLMRSGVVAMTVLAGAMLAACAAPRVVPPDSAPPGVVLNAYLGALRDGDCGAARSLTTPTFGKGNGELCGDIDVSAFTALVGPARPKDGEVVYSTTLSTGGDGISINAGDTIWFYQLDRQPTGAWRITGGGSGP